MVEFSKSMGLAVFTDQFADSPHLLSFLEANFTGVDAETARRELMDLADSSDFSLRQWVESLRTLRAWLDARGLALSIDDELGYVSCAEEASGPGSQLTYLPGLVADMLEAYGCERAEPRAALKVRDED
jgi:hypothetical protein